MNAETSLMQEKMVFRKTNRNKGRHISVTPLNSTNKHLSYGRIILDESTPSVSFDNQNQETGLICLSGSGMVKVGADSFRVGQYDSLYIPPDSHIDLSTASSIDLAEFSSDVEQKYPVQFVPYTELIKDPALKFSTGTAGQMRHLNICLGKNVRAGRLIIGFTISEPGNWTSWPPHEHAAMLEEMYVYINMPAPAFGIQLVYNNTEYPELVVPVREGDAVLMPAGYHPNVSVPGHTVAFLWAMAAHREQVDRQFGVVNIQPGFNTNGSGLEASRK
ncbi:MAG TPA: 5-deoxy-glucuronate isomerase [Verrucomicrobiae bacterium]|nr:5-deoxy-glucuronate isomerase [Verrucomicrobiae bacterium]